MKKKWSKIFETTPDYLREQAKLTCGDHPLFALIELITNSNEAYNKLEAKGIKHRGEIIIDIHPHRKKSRYTVKDFALGLDEKDISEKVKKIGGDQSGLNKKMGGRSFYGRGLKEALINFGCGEIESIKNNKLFKASSADVELTYEGEGNAFQIDRNRLGAKPNENCTSISLIAFREHIQKTPQYENLKDGLIKYFELRDILRNNSRKIILRYHRQGGIINEEILTYTPIPSNKIKEEKIKLNDFPKADLLLEIYEAEKDIPYVQDKYLSERGFLICSNNAIHAIDYFGLQNHQASSRIFGRISSNYIDFLMRDKREMLFESTRSGGVNTKHLFIKSLTKETQKALVLIYEEFKDKEGKTNELQDKETDNNVKKALQYLNKVARNLLNDEAETGSGKGKKIKKKKQDLLPPDGFNFMPPYIQAPVDSPTTITLKLSDENGKPKKKLLLSSENKNISILSDREKEWEFNKKGFWVFRTSILGKNIGDSTIITARLGDLTTEIKIEIIAKNKGKGLFNGWAIETGLPPEQRVQYIRGTGKISISADAPSVKPFVVSYNKLHSMKLRNIETRILIAELILNACCGEIARQMVLRGKEPLLRTEPDGIAEQVQDLLVRLTNEHARAIQLIVTKGKLEEHIKK